MRSIYLVGLTLITMGGLAYENLETPLNDIYNSIPIVEPSEKIDAFIDHLIELNAPATVWLYPISNGTTSNPVPTSTTQLRNPLPTNVPLASILEDGPLITLPPSSTINLQAEPPLSMTVAPLCASASADSSNTEVITMSWLSINYPVVYWAFNTVITETPHGHSYHPERNTYHLSHELLQALNLALRPLQEHGQTRQVTILFREIMAADHFNLLWRIKDVETLKRLLLAYIKSPMQVAQLITNIENIATHLSNSLSIELHSILTHMLILVANELPQSHVRNLLSQGQIQMAAWMIVLNDQQVRHTIGSGNPQGSYPQAFLKDVRAITQNYPHLFSSLVDYMKRNEMPENSAKKAVNVLLFLIAQKTTVFNSCSSDLPDCVPQPQAPLLTAINNSLSQNTELISGVVRILNHPFLLRIAACMANRLHNDGVSERGMTSFASYLLVNVPQRLGMNEPTPLIHWGIAAMTAAANPEEMTIDNGLIEGSILEVLGVKEIPKVEEKKTRLLNVKLHIYRLITKFKPELLDSTEASDRPGVLSAIHQLLMDWVNGKHSKEKRN